MTIKNIIYDLGGVIMNLDFSLTSDAFRRLGAFNFDDYFAQNNHDRLFDLIETGKISADEFRQSLKKMLDLTVNDTDFDRAWNAMLLDFPPERLECVRSARQNYRVFLFSNTNEIHLKKILSNCQNQHGHLLDEFFERQYYSHLLGQRKPSPDSFISILHENNLNADETLFIDDTLKNVVGARQAGLHAFHLTADKSILDTVKFIEEADKYSVDEDSRLGIDFDRSL